MFPVYVKANAAMYVEYVKMFVLLEILLHALTYSCLHSE